VESKEQRVESGALRAEGREQKYKFL